MPIFRNRSMLRAYHMITVDPIGSSYNTIVIGGAHLPRLMRVIT